MLRWGRPAHGLEPHGRKSSEHFPSRGEWPARCAAVVLKDAGRLGCRGPVTPGVVTLDNGRHSAFTRG